MPNPNADEFKLRSIIGSPTNDLLNLDHLPVGRGMTHPDCNKFLQIASHAQIPGANINVFLNQVGGWVWQFRFASKLDGDRHEFKTAMNEVKTAIKRLVHALDYLDKHPFASFMLNTQLSRRLDDEWPELSECMYAFHRGKISGPINEGVLSRMSGETNLQAIKQAMDRDIEMAMEPEVEQIAGIRHQLKTMIDAARFLSAARLPGRGENRTKKFMAGILRIVEMNGGNLTYDKNEKTGTLADVYEFFRASMPAETWTDLSPSTLQRLKSKASRTKSRYFTGP